MHAVARTVFALAVFALHLESERREQEVQPCPTVPCADDMVVIIPVEINIKYEAVAGPNPDAVAARYSREHVPKSNCASSKRVLEFCRLPSWRHPGC